jgi:hypothetical protein
MEIKNKISLLEAEIETNLNAIKKLKNLIPLAILIGLVFTFFLPPINLSSGQTLNLSYIQYSILRFIIFFGVYFYSYNKAVKKRKLNIKILKSKLIIMQQLLTKKSFPETITHIDENYTFTPTTFKNGNQINNASENNGSCKIFAFAQLNNLSKEETLSLFGDFYQDVLNTPEATDHQNIRNFMIFGWDGIQFEGVVLRAK